MKAFLSWLMPPWEYRQCRAELEVLRGRMWAYCIRRHGHPGSCRTNDGKLFRRQSIKP